MDKSVYNMKAEKIQKLVKAGDYETAVKICDDIDWSQIRSARMLSLVSSVYEHVRRYDTAIDILLQAYEEAPVGKRFLYKLTELALAAGNIKEAEEYYKSYLQEATDDPLRYILRYKIAEAKHEALDKRIIILETYKKLEFEEEWSCKLAELYDMAGMADKCVSVCDEVFLWFGAGPFVERVVELKSKYAPLTPEQQSLLDQKYYYEEQMLNGGVQIAVDEESGSAMNYAADDMASGRSVSSLDTSIINEEPVEEPVDNLSLTKVVSDKEDFSHTRVFRKVSEGGPTIFDTATVESAPEDAETTKYVPIKEVPAFEPVKEQEDVQLSFNFDMDIIEDEPEPEPEPAPSIWDETASRKMPEEEEKIPEQVSKIIYLGTDSPAQAIEEAVARLSAAHERECTPVAKVTRITGSKLNAKGLFNSLRHIRGKDLIVLGASVLDTQEIKELKSVVSELEPDKFFVLADSPAGIERLRRRIEEGEEEQEIAAENAEEIEIAEEIAEAGIAPEAVDSEAIEESAEVAEEAEIKIETEPEVAEESGINDETGTEVEEAVVEPVAIEEPVIEITHQEDESEALIPEEVIEEESVEEPEVVSEPEPEEEPEAEAEPVAKPEPAKPREKTEEEKKLDEFYEMVLDYIKQIDCVLEDGIDGELYDYCKKLAQDGENLDMKLAQEIIEDAADEAERKTIGNMFRSRYDSEGYLILRMKHFD